MVLTTTTTKGPNVVSLVSEDLEEALVTLEQGLADMETLWDTIAAPFDTQPHGDTSNGITITLTLSNEDRHVSALLDLAASRDPSISHLRSTTRTSLGKLGVSTIDESYQKNESMDHVGLRTCGSSKYLALGIRLCRLLQCLPHWRLQVCPEASRVTDLVVKVIWMTLLDELLGSLRQATQHVLESACFSEFCTSKDQLTRLQEHFEGYSQCATRPRLERLIASRRSTSGYLRNIHQSMSNAISSLCDNSNHLNKTTIIEATHKENVQAMTVVDKGGPKPRESSSILTICTTKDGNDQALGQRSLDDFLNRPLL